MEPNPSQLFGSVIGLGRFKKLYPYNKRKALTDPWFLLCFAFLAVWAMLASTPPFSGSVPFSEILSTRSFFAALGSGAVIALCLALLARRDQRNWSIAAALYESGFAYHDRNGLLPLRWDQISAIEDQIGEREVIEGIMTVEGSTALYHTVHTDIGQTIILSHRLIGIEELWGAIEELMAARELPVRLREIQSGQTLTFGPFAVDRDGMHLIARKKPRFIKWRDIQSAEFDPDSPISWAPGHRQITIMKKCDDARHEQLWAFAEKSEVPNAYVLLGLCKHLLRGLRDYEPSLIQHYSTAGIRSAKRS